MSRTIRKTDEELLMGSLKGRKGDFRSLLERYEGELFNFLYHCTRDRQTAEDLFQETFMQVYAKMETFRVDGRFKPWVYTIAANMARDEMRKRRRRKTYSLDKAVKEDGEGKMGDFLPSDADGPGEILEREESMTLARRLMSELPENLREVVSLYFFGEMKYAEISEVLDLPMGTVKSRMFRAIRQMSAIMKHKRGF